MGRAIIAGRGDLPGAIFAADTSAVFVTMDGVAATVPDGAAVIQASFEKLGRLFSDLRAAEVDEIVMAGAMDRPSLNPARFDMKMVTLAPGLIKAFRAGDDGLLRKVISIFEAEGFTIISPADVAPTLTCPAGSIAGPKPTKALLADAARATEVLAALGSLDIGQAAVAASGQVLGIETIQGTDALLDFVSQTSGAKRGTGGVLVKAPKPGQDLRVDMPTIGPDTIDRAVAAGLKGLQIAAGSVLILGQEAVCAKAKSAGFSLWAVETLP